MAVPAIQTFTRPADVLKRYGVSHPTLWRWSRSGNFPRPVKLGPNTCGYRNSELDEFDNDPAAWRAKNAPKATA